MRNHRLLALLSLAILAAPLAATTKHPADVPPQPRTEFKVQAVLSAIAPLYLGGSATPIGCVVVLDIGVPMVVRFYYPNATPMPACTGPAAPGDLVIVTGTISPAYCEDDMCVHALAFSGGTLRRLTP